MAFKKVGFKSTSADGATAGMTVVLWHPSHPNGTFPYGYYTNALGLQGRTVAPSVEKKEMIVIKKALVNWEGLG